MSGWHHWCSECKGFFEVSEDYPLRRGCPTCNKRMNERMIETVREHMKSMSDYEVEKIKAKDKTTAAGLSAPEGAPTEGQDVPVWDLVMTDMRQRDQAGRLKYGRPLQADNGRKHLIDAYQEALDMVVYLRAEIRSRYGI